MKSRVVSLFTFIAVTFALLACASVPAMAALINGSFEDGVTGWATSTNGQFSSQVTTSGNGFGVVPSDGSNYARIYSHSSFTDIAYSVGQYGQISQFVNLTGISSLSFDASLNQNYGLLLDTWNPIFEASLIIAGNTLWSANAYGDYAGTVVDVSSITGLVEVVFRNAVVTNGATMQQSNWFGVDNVVAQVAAVPAPATLPLLLSALGGFALLSRRRRRTMA